MNKAEFIKTLDSCIHLTNSIFPNLIYYYLDENIIRQRKLNNLLDIKSSTISINLDNLDKDNFLFYLNLDKNLLKIKYKKIWLEIFKDELSKT